MGTLITVQGHFTAWYPAERATVLLAVGFDGAERESVLASALSERRGSLQKARRVE